MRQRISTIVRRSLLLMVLVLAACQPSTPPSVQSSWSDQLAAIEKTIPNLNDDFVLVEGTAPPKREPGESHGADEPIELRVYLAFQGQKSTQVDADGSPLYVMRYVTLSDYHLATTLSVSGEELHTRSSDAPAIQARLIRLSAQDALQLTLAEGQTYMGRPVDRGNILIHLRGMGDNSAESSAHPVWELIFYKGKDHTLTILVDAQTGAILKRTEA